MNSEVVPRMALDMWDISFSTGSPLITQPSPPWPPPAASLPTVLSKDLSLLFLRRFELMPLPRGRRLLLLLHPSGDAGSAPGHRAQRSLCPGPGIYCWVGLNNVSFWGGDLAGTIHQLLRAKENDPWLFCWLVLGLLKALRGGLFSATAVPATSGRDEETEAQRGHMACPRPLSQCDPTSLPPGPPAGRRPLPLSRRRREMSSNKEQRSAVFVILFALITILILYSSNSANEVFHYGPLRGRTRRPVNLKKWSISDGYVPILGNKPPAGLL
ncbi:alpha-N-acetylgalactosaminide alpha-2,6-sialyltransferase 6 isoform X5 [Suricata suricatta]|uniref:alpha-N-acetylgalactosaminide alpha-2,6-sialyltransferase 6 isoform X5 n=1 Tax=Suricata suricatta TaxID=37032 RepID=UPI00115546B8|nr:alpha-N-acetylgalactosaminide alpha-2,6-sialyltransferase 6 isoform X5 [Suricata suricatta]